MNKLFETENFNMTDFVRLLEEDGFDIHNTGGSQNPDYINGSVYLFKSGQAHLLGDNASFISCSANTFYQTLIDVEERFKYQLFG